MKKVWLLLFLCFLAACSSDDDGIADGRIKVTQSEIQGSWLMTTSTSTETLYYSLTFSGNLYLLQVVNDKMNWTHREMGEFSISGYSISADALVFFSDVGSTRSIIDGNEIYWETSAKEALHISPLGTFYVR